MVVRVCYLLVLQATIIRLVYKPIHLYIHIRINNNFTSSIHIIFLSSHSLKSQINPKTKP